MSVATDSDPADPLDEPDYRFTLANERTVLAWFRTSLALLAASVALSELVPDLRLPGATTALSVLMGLLSVVASLGGALRWRRVQEAIRRGAPLPSTSVVPLQAVGLSLVAAVVVVAAVVSHR